MYALVDANSFYASCERVFRPDLADRAVVVLSNNDGCIIARSKEAKALKIDMGVPYFQIRDLLQKHHVAVFSSNYTLYDDMSRRVQDVLRCFADEIEVYSIDESFLRWNLSLDWPVVGQELKQTVLQWTGLPVGVGIAPTKTLAKLANHLSKRAKNATGVHVLHDPQTITDALQAVQMTDLWGISSRYRNRLERLGLFTPIQLQQADPRWIRKNFGVVMMRTVYELRGEPCIPLETIRPNKQNICCSRSFGTVAKDLNTMIEAVSTFACQAGAKMRNQDLVTGRIGVFIQTDRHANVPQYAASWAVGCPMPTNDSRHITQAAIWCLKKIYRPQHHYKKAAVLLFELSARCRAQRGLFQEEDQPEESRKLMRVMDQINNDFGRGTIRLACASPFTLGPCRTWHVRSDHRSPRYTTRWEDIPVARPI